MNAKTTRLKAADWVERRLRPDWSAEDQAAFNDWLTCSDNKVAYLRAQSAWTRAERLTALRPTSIQPMRVKKTAGNPVWSGLRRIAAGLMGAAIIGTLFYQQIAAPSAISYVTAIGEHKAVTFKDGTRVELNTDTHLRISRKDSERKIWLDKGEAYFEVEHDAAHPLIVIVDGRTVTDLGTKFVVRQDAGRLNVTVVEGLVEVAAQNDNPQSLLKPGDILTATPQAQSVAHKSLRSILAGLNWKQGKLFLEDATLAEAANEFNRYNSRKLVISDPKLASLTVTGTFQARNLEAFAKVTKELFGAKSEITNDQIILSSKSYSPADN